MPLELLKEWDKLSADEKKMFIRQVDVYAAYLMYVDHEIGRVIQAVEDMGRLDNTLILGPRGQLGIGRDHAQLLLVLEDLLPQLVPALVKKMQVGGFFDPFRRRMMGRMRSARHVIHEERLLRRQSIDWFM